MGNLKSCPICHKSFAQLPNKSKKYCAKQCRWTAHKRKERLERQLENKCPQCGGPMDHPLGAQGKRISYCSKCRKYFEKHYRG